MRVDINDGIFHPNNNHEDEIANNSEHKDVDYEVYTMKGQEDKLNNNLPVIEDIETLKAIDRETAYAAKSHDSYYIKTKGSTLIDPLTLFTRDLRQSVGNHNPWQWKEVRKKVFDLYLKYLQTKNKNYYDRDWEIK